MTAAHREKGTEANPIFVRRKRFFRAGHILELFLIGIAAFACGGENFSKVRNLHSAGETIICFGDSLTEGVGAEPGEDYPSILSRLLGLPVVNTGARGDTTTAALERLAGEVLRKNPRLVIILLGGNDFLRQRPRGETRKNLEEIVRRVQAHGAMVAIAGIRLGVLGDDYAEIFKETAERFGALYIPQVLNGILTDAGLRSDPIHPNGKGYRLIAERIAEKIKPLLRESDRLRVTRAGR
jgi:lysophospholipase L1-like esterase